MVTVERSQDARLAHDIEQSAGLQRGGREVARRFGVSEGYLAREDATRTPIGVGTLTVYAGEPSPPLAWIGGMAVRGEARRRGAARAILRGMLSRARELRVRVVGLDASALGQPLYESEGFEIVGRTSRWARAAPREDAVLSTRHSVHPISLSEAMEIGAFDEPRFGARRLPLLLALQHDFPWHAFLSRDRASGDVSGFILASERAMGPLVADDEDAASALLSACERAGAPPKLLVMDDDARATRTLAAAGYAPDGAACTRMTLGGPLPGARASVLGAATWAMG